MESKKYAVTCEKCGKTSKLQIINGVNVLYIDHIPIISARLRGDQNWGFECICGNDSRVAPEEKKDLDMLVQIAEPKFKENVIQQIAKTLTIKNHLKFRMEKI